MSNQTDPSGTGVAVTKSDTTSLELGGTLPRAIYVGGAGDVNVQFGDLLTSVLFSSVAAGTILPIRPTRVMSASTTATNMVALY